MPTRGPTLRVMARAGQSQGRTRGGRGPKSPHRAFAARLVELRAAAGITQSQLAARLGASRRQIAYYESGRGRPPGALLGLLADLFRISTDQLLGREVARAPGRLPGALAARIREVDRLGADALRRLEALLDAFIAAESARHGARGRPGTGRRGARAARARR